MLILLKTEKMPVLWPRSENGKITKTVHGKVDGNDEGKTEEMMDRRSARIHGGGPGGVQLSGGRQVSMTEVKRRCHLKGSSRY